MVILLTKDSSETSRTRVYSESCLLSRIKIGKRWSCCQAFLDFIATFIPTYLTLPTLLSATVFLSTRGRIEFTCSFDCLTCLCSSLQGSWHSIPVLLCLVWQWHVQLCIIISASEFGKMLQIENVGHICQ